MMETISKFNSSGILFVLTLVFGVWLSQSGKPYNSLLFNIHKLVALGTVIVVGVQLSRMLKNTDPLALIIALLVVAALCVVALFASGALMSMGKLDYTLTLTIHRIALGVLVIGMVLEIYLLGRQV
jgi:hypothetical protein